MLKLFSKPLSHESTSSLSPVTRIVTSRPLKRPLSVRPPPPPAAAAAAPARGGFRTVMMLAFGPLRSTVLSFEKRNMDWMMCVVRWFSWKVMLSVWRMANLRLHCEKMPPVFLST